MTEKAKKLLSDIHKAIQLTEEFIKNTDTFQQYQQEAKTQSAVERQLEILREAVNKFRKEAPDCHLSHASRIIAFRNRLAHNYDGIDDSIVWAVIKTHLPILKTEVHGYTEPFGD